MSEGAKHTPGPWWNDGPEVGTVPMMTVKTAKADGRSYGETMANARLIAAAPEMLAALKAFPSVTIDMRKSARYNAKEIIAIAVWAQEYCAPAIAKAEGRAV